MKILVSLFSAVVFAAFAATAAEPAAPVEALPPTGGASIQTIVAPPADKIPEVDPFKLYDGDILFDVYRKGKKVGEESVVFTRNASGDLFVQARFHIGVDVLFFTAYTFDYDSSEIWRDNKVIAMTSHADDDGKVASISARMEDGVFKIEGPHGTILASSWVFPTNHWHRGQVESSTILNTLTGVLAHVSIQPHGIDKVATEQGPVEAARFTYTGDLHDTDVWYDAAGRWVKMSFKAKDGSTIEFVCRKCGQPVQG